MQQKILVFLFVILPASLWAQDSLSLAEAIAFSLDNNYGIRIADMRTNVAAAQNTWGNAGALPRLDLNVSGRYFQSGNPASFLRSNQSVSPGLSLSWTVFDGFAMFANKTRLELLEDQSLGNAAVIVENNIQGIMVAYYDALVAQEGVAVLKEVLENSRERLEYEEFRLELGSTSTFDLLQFKNAVIVDSTNLVTQELNLLNAIRTLNQLMNAPIGNTYVLSDSLNADFDQYDVEDLRNSMIADNNNLRNQYMTQQIREQETRAARALYYPNLSVTAGTNYAVGQVGLADGSTRSVQAGDFSVGFTLSFNLFNGFNTQRQVEVANLNEKITELETQDLERSLENELFVVHDNYDARRRLLDLQSQNVENARLNLELANDRFQSGLINSFDFRQIQLQYLNAQLERLRALRNLNASETDLIRLTGGLVREG